jgi:hypothetical protein
MEDKSIMVTVSCMDCQDSGNQKPLYRNLPYFAHNQLGFESPVCPRNQSGKKHECLSYDSIKNDEEMLLCKECDLFFLVPISVRADTDSSTSDPIIESLIHKRGFTKYCDGHKTKHQDLKTHTHDLVKSGNLCHCLKCHASIPSCSNIGEDHLLQYIGIPLICSASKDDNDDDNTVQNNTAPQEKNNDDDDDGDELLELERKHLELKQQVQDNMEQFTKKMDIIASDAQDVKDQLKTSKEQIANLLDFNKNLINLMTGLLSAYQTVSNVR